MLENLSVGFYDARVLSFFRLVSRHYCEAAFDHNNAGGCVGMKIDVTAGTSSNDCDHIADLFSLAKKDETRNVVRRNRAT